jgi:hypothetical protein
MAMNKKGSYKDFQRSQRSTERIEKEALQKAKDLAKRKHIVLTDDTLKPENVKCSDCNSDLIEPTWFREEILYLGQPIIKYWFVWGEELRPAAYCWPTHRKTFICTSCFDNRESERASKRANGQKSLKSVAKTVIEMMKNPTSDHV